MVVLSLDALNIQTQFGLLVVRSAALVARHLGRLSLHEGHDLFGDPAEPVEVTIEVVDDG